MKVILTKNVAKLGNAGDIVDVSTGFAMNKLLPSNQAKLATASAEASANAAAAKKAKDTLEFKEWAKAAVAKLAGKTLLFTETTSGKGKLFGSIAEKNIVDRIKEQFSLEVEESQIQLAKHIKSLGDHRVEICLSPNYSATVSVRVEAK